MRPIAEIPTETCRRLRGILCDLDDTLTSGGRLPPEAFAALWRAHRAGLRLVVVTGRPAGWADHLARMWPVDAVVGENGAFYFHMAGGRMRRRWALPEDVRREHRARLDALARAILDEVPGAAIAADQFCRASDLAIDFAEDVPTLPDEEVERIAAAFRRFGAEAKVSSIHVNGWFGGFDKLSCMRLVAEELWHEDLAVARERYVYCGDSPNDEPMFAFFPGAVGVANVRRWIGAMAHPPAYVTARSGGAGFAELVDLLLSRRGALPGRDGDNADPQPTG